MHLVVSPILSLPCSFQSTLVETSMLDIFITIILLFYQIPRTVDGLSVDTDVQPLAPGLHAVRYMSAISEDPNLHNHVASPLRVSDRAFEKDLVRELMRDYERLTRPVRSPYDP